MSKLIASTTALKSVNRSAAAEFVYEALPNMAADLRSVSGADMRKHMNAISATLKATLASKFPKASAFVLKDFHDQVMEEMALVYMVVEKEKKKSH